MGEDNLKIELVNKDDVINALIPILCEFSVEPYTQGRIIGSVLNCPIAYDVETVVEELKELSNAEADYYYANSNDVIDRETAIEIVENGGKK